MLWHVKYGLLMCFTPHTHTHTHTQSNKHVHTCHSSTVVCIWQGVATHLSFGKQQHADHSEEAEVERQQQDDTAETREHRHSGEGPWGVSDQSKSSSLYFRCTPLHTAGITATGSSSQHSFCLCSVLPASLYRQVRPTHFLLLCTHSFTSLWVILLGSSLLFFWVITTGLCNSHHFFIFQFSFLSLLWQTVIETMLPMSLGNLKNPVSTAAVFVVR